MVAIQMSLFTYLKLTYYLLNKSFYLYWLKFEIFFKKI